MKNKYMNIAFEEANKAYNIGEVPIGCVIVLNDEIVAAAHNMKEKNNNSLDHAEMIAIREASLKLSNWRLDDCEMYVTLDPCPMCSSAIKQSRIKKVFSALQNSDSKLTEIVEKIFEKDNTNPGVFFVTNLAVEKSLELLNKFFENKRK